MPIKNRFNELLPEMTAWRRDFHANPELLYDTHRTAGIIAKKLREFGCDEAVNIIPQTVTLPATARALDRAEQDMAKARITQTTEGIAVARAISGACAELPPSMGSEDFAFLLLERPGAFMMVSNGNSAPLHNPGHEFNGAAMPCGSSWFLSAVESRMPVAP